MLAELFFVTLHAVLPIGHPDINLKIFCAGGGLLLRDDGLNCHTEIKYGFFKRDRTFFEIRCGEYVHDC